ncbi:hypothetical protein O0I10_007102 [Lichtheimia ornata]|uniref:Very long-chain fatty acid transport protein n=1 Tax=Lichtheimia ornata TaxID=688661 RepID=A0AAD7V2F8_9FUNG|nr:uncharacterized protein O0I10_007102 [Lichtheimia ornata]KAJ8657286.1 hypothetical protein O0I10_007102 [Lichtheimia ornata]
MDPVTVATAVAGGVLGGYILDSSTHIRNDFHQLRVALGSALKVRAAIRQQREHLYYRFEEKAKATPDRIFLYFEDKTYTFRQVEQASNRLARWLLTTQNVKPRDVVCMMHPNHPLFMVTWLAILKIGAIPSLLNTNLNGESLVHCVQVSKARLFLFDPQYTEQVQMAASSLDGVAVYGYGEGYTDKFPMITEEILAGFSSDDTDKKLLKVEGPEDPALLIYTSGTTGMPKAAILTHYRTNLSCWAMAAMAQTRSTDITYTCLPMFHSSGLIVSLGATMVGGGSIVIARKFSVSRFWDDIYKYKVTIFHYIGELCRYLVNQPPHPLEKKHSLRLIFGNGMRYEVWKPMRERFGIRNVVEFYAATEGLGIFFINSKDGKGAGAIGQHGLLMRLLSRGRTKIIKIDPITQEPYRNKQGFCVECAPGESGEFIARFDNLDLTPFTGYFENKKATSKKILRDAFIKGDAYFRSGDLIRYEKNSYYYFDDRLGDTFRWHGENVATTEVSHAMSNYPGIAEVNVYGTLVPNHDGRAGMAAIVLKPGVTSLDMSDLYQHMSKRLPRYAIPRFLRFLPEMTITGTFKQQKYELQKQGIDNVPEDQPLYWLVGDTYTPFGSKELQQVKQGKAKL